MSGPGSRAARRAATAQRILDAARAEFGERGLEATTIRRIAKRANVDPSLVMQHYGSKGALFAIAIQLGEASPGEIETHLHDVLDVRLAALPPETKALVRSMLTAPEATESMSAFLNERIANLSHAMGGDDADLRAALIVSSILGLTIARHFLKLDAFTSASDADIARVAGHGLPPESTLPRDIPGDPRSPAEPHAGLLASDREPTGYRPLAIEPPGIGRMRSSPLGASIAHQPHISHIRQEAQS